MAEENNYRADPKTGKVSVISPTGQYGTIDPAELTAALSSGYKYESPEERITRIEGAQYGGGIVNPLAAGALGAARTLTAGGSDVIARAAGLAPEVRKLREYNPVTSLAGEIGSAFILPSGKEGAAKGLVKRAGAISPLGLVTRGAQTATQGMANRIVQAASREAIIGAGFGAGQTISDAALSEEDQTPESIATSLISNVGLGALTGAAGGAAFEKILGSGTKTAQRLLKADEAVEATAQNVPKNILDVPVTGTIGPEQTALGAEIRAQVRPDSVDAIKALNSAYEGMGLGAGDLPTAQRLNEVKAILGDEMKIKPLIVHEEMAASKKARDIYGTLLRDTPSADAEALLRYEQNFKKQAELGIADAITAGGPKEFKPLYEAGDEILSGIKSTHAAERKTLGDIFEKIGAKEIPAGAHNADFVVSLSKDIPFLGRAMKVSPNGKISFDAFSPKFGIDEASYNILKKVGEAVNDSEVTIKDLQGIREYIRQSKDVTSLGSKTLDQVRKTMLDHVSKVTELYKPDAKIREAITRYAINEGNLDKLERIIGGKVDALNLLDKAVPENVVGKIFSNSNNMQAAREILGEQRFADLTKNYVNSFVEKATDKVKGGFSSQKFHSEIQKKSALLKQAMGEERYNKLLAWTDAARLIPDAPPVNSSGTAKSGLIRSAFDAGKKAINLQMGDAVGAIDDYLQAKSNLKLMGDVLKGQKTLMDIQKTQNKSIKESVKQLFEKGKGVVGGKKDNAARAITKGVLSISSIKAEHDKQVEKIANLANNPEMLAEALGVNTSRLAEYDPAIQSQVVQKAQAGINYLNSIAPKNPGITDALDPNQEYRASDAEYMKWARSYKVVNQPLSILDDMKQGLLTPDSVKALVAVYPDLHARIMKGVVDESAKTKRPLSFEQKNQLSILAQHPMKSSFNPQFIAAMQKNYQQGSEQQAPRPTAGGMKQLNLAEGSQTNLQRVLSR